jgi:hypothetical protein
MLERILKLLKAAYPGHQRRMVLLLNPMPKHGNIMNKTSLPAEESRPFEHKK